MTNHCHDRRPPATPLAGARDGAGTVTELELRLEFDRANRNAVWRDLVAAVRRRPNRLTPYYEVAPRTGSESYRGLQTVPLSRIVGSLERADDFDCNFLPRRRDSADRWLRVARAYAEGLPLPPVQLYEVGGNYFVKDGHHRVSVARVNGQGFIEAEVTAISVPVLGGPTESRQRRSPRRLTGSLRSLERVPGRLFPARRSNSSTATPALCTPPAPRTC